MRKSTLNQLTMAIVSAVPLFNGTTSLGEAAFLSVSVLSAVFTFEMIFSLTKRFWLRSLRPLFALLILASVLGGVFLICDFLLLEQVRAVRVFPLTLVSAFLLVQSTLLANETSSNRIRVWAQFSILLLIVGIFRQLSGIFREFPPAPFWISGLVLGVFFFLKPKEKVS